MSSAPNKKWDEMVATPTPESTDTGTNSGEILRLPDSMPDNMAALGAPLPNDIPTPGLPVAPQQEFSPNATQIVATELEWNPPSLASLPVAENVPDMPPPPVVDDLTATNVSIDVSHDELTNPGVAVQELDETVPGFKMPEELLVPQVAHVAAIAAPAAVATPDSEEITVTEIDLNAVENKATLVATIQHPQAVEQIAPAERETKISQADKTDEYVITPHDKTDTYEMRVPAAIAIDAAIDQAIDAENAASAAEAAAEEVATAGVELANVVEKATQVAHEVAVVQEATPEQEVAVVQEVAAAQEATLTQELSSTTNIFSRITKTQKRVALAAAISAAGFIFTITWYNLTSSGRHSSNSKPIAKIIRTMNEVQRKPITKLIWQPIFDKDIIYTGEAIRTASNAETTIEFLEGGTKIDLDPDSAIVLEESAGKLALNFLQGNLLVKAGKGGAEGASDITLKTGEKQIALGNSELSLGKSSSGQLDLQVLKGQAQIEGADGKTITVDQGKSLSGLNLSLLKPTGDDAIYIDLAEKEKVSFEWQQLNQGDYTVTLEVGPTRNSMKPVAGAVATGASGKLEAELKVGRVYYRLVARSADANFKELTSSIVKNTVIAKVPPNPIAPENESMFSISQEAPSVMFQWSNPANLSEVHFKLSRTQDFKTLLFEKTLPNSQNTVSLDLKSSGKYYWQLTGRAGGKNIAASKIASFDVNVTKGVPAPRLLKPIDLEKVPYDQFKENGLLLSWEQVGSAAKYKLVVEGGKEPVTIETELLQNRIRDLKPGTYTWSVWSENTKGDLSPNAEKRQFQLVELPLVPWADGKSEGDYQYITLKPTLDLMWTKPAAPAVRYQVHVTPDGGDSNARTPSAIKTQNVIGLNVTLPVENDGNYFAEIEGLDANGKVVARSQRRTVRVMPAPLLPPPAYAEGLPIEILANGSGAASVQWNAVQGAAKYVVILKNSTGESKREIAFTTAEGQLKGLMPGDYKVVLKSVDVHGRPGPEGEERVLKVPNTSSLRAPKMKGLKVK